MDLRIVNTCNNDCLYCLEKSLRKKEKYIKKEVILNKLKQNLIKDNITFYGGNPLLHPDILEIIKYSQIFGFKNIGLLTNTFFITNTFLKDLKKVGLSSIGFYFNNFNIKKHKLITNNGIILEELVNNINNIKRSGLFYKSIIHINKQNIKSISKDVIILNKKFLVKDFEFINYFPFDKPYNNKNILEYNIKKNRSNINKLFLIIKKLKINVNFVKFSKDFFGKFVEYYNYKKCILNQIGEEDLLILGGEQIPFCYNDNRCHNCFMKDCCKWYKKV